MIDDAKTISDAVALVDAAAVPDACTMPAGDRALLRRIASTMNFRDRTWGAIAAAFRDRTGRPPPPWDERAGLKRRALVALVAWLTARRRL